MSVFGVLIFPTAYSMPMGQLAQAVEERGFESLFVCEHTHIPVCLLYTSPSPRDQRGSRMPSSA